MKNDTVHGSVHDGAILTSAKSSGNGKKWVACHTPSLTEFSATFFRRVFLEKAEKILRHPGEYLLSDFRCLDGMCLGSSHTKPQEVFAWMSTKMSMEVIVTS